MERMERLQYSVSKETLQLMRAKEICLEQRKHGLKEEVESERVCPCVWGGVTKTGRDEVVSVRASTKKAFVLIYERKVLL